MERLTRVEQRAMRGPAAFHLEPALPALRAHQPRAQGLVAAGDLAAFEPREAKFRVLLPVPVGGERRQAAKARLAFAHRLLGGGALEVLPDHRGDDVQRLVQPLVRRAHAPAGDVEHRGDAAGGPHREHDGCDKAGAFDEGGAQRARIGAGVGDPGRLAGLPDRADQPRAARERKLARAFDEALGAFDRRVEPLRIAAQYP